MRIDFARVVSIAVLALVAGMAAFAQVPAILETQAEVKPTDAALAGPAGVTTVTDSMATLFSTRAQADALLAIANRDLHRENGPACELYDAVAEFQFPPFHGLVYFGSNGPRIWGIRCQIDVAYTDSEGRPASRQVRTANYIGYMVYRRAVLKGMWNYGLPYGGRIGFYEYFEGEGTLVWIR